MNLPYNSAIYVVLSTKPPRIYLKAAIEVASAGSRPSSETVEICPFVKADAQCSIEESSEIAEDSRQSRHRLSTGAPS